MEVLIYEIYANKWLAHLSVVILIENIYIC